MKRIFYYESPQNCRIVAISLDEVEELAQDRGDTRCAEDMDDDSFFSYCDFILGV
jgi:hypothetical protein